MKFPFTAGELTKNATEKVKITLAKYRGDVKVDARTWFLDERSGDWKPTKRGFALPVAEVQSLSRIFKRAAKKARRNGLGRTDEKSSSGRKKRGES